MRRILAAILVCAGALLAPAAPASARNITVERLDAELLVRRDGSLLVTEHIRVVFEGSWNGLLRTIPVEYPGPRGSNYTLFVRGFEARDEQGGRLEIKKRRLGSSIQLRIYLPGAADATRTITLTYTVSNALRFFEGYDELYWNVVSNDGDVPTQHAGVRVYLPPQVTGLRMAAYEGQYGSTDRASVDSAGGAFVQAGSIRTLGLNEGLTVDVAWGPGVVARPTAFALALRFLASNWALGFPILSLVLLYVLWYKRGRDPRLRPIAPMYEPPDRMSPAEAGTLLDNTPDMRDITASMVDLAVRGFLTVEELTEEKAFGLVHKREYVLTCVKERAAWGELEPADAKLMDALFEGGSRSTVRTSELVNHFYLQLPGIKSAVYNQLIARGYYRQRPDQVMATYIFLGALLGVAIGGGGSAFARRVLGQPILPFIVAGVLTFIIWILFARIMPARTQGGAAALEKVLGFQEFLRRVESDRLQRVVKTPEMFERCLPYAMAFGVEENWAHAFESICREPPSWYRGRTGPFRAALFTSDLGHMCGRVGSAMQSSPRGSSSGSGFSGGGGSSGGGFGGGSVGGF